MENELEMALEDREREEKRTRWMGMLASGFLLWDFLSACQGLRWIEKHLRDST
jgi:hypothetical protein